MEYGLYRIERLIVYAVTGYVSDKERQYMRVTFTSVPMFLIFLWSSGE